MLRPPFFFIKIVKKLVSFISDLLLSREPRRLCVSLLPFCPFVSFDKTGTIFVQRLLVIKGCV